MYFIICYYIIFYIQYRHSGATLINRFSFDYITYNTSYDSENKGILKYKILDKKLIQKYFVPQSFI